ncbi:HalD/BesD family halogenase [Roseomonas mucosa]|uniref:HalD/BesD family halogenase n=1 Tax=Roseomonas mucosa TaxID=207340 RepID=UPI0022484C33|nr:hypothetical protein [Roseomonas mucosa]UZO94766.1 A-factor receptor protein ArpA [Roseomonas mucosa]
MQNAQSNLDISTLVLNPGTESFFQAHVQEAASDFARDNFVRIGHLLPQEWKLLVRQEVLRLLEQRAVRRDFLMESTGNTPRRMFNVKSEEIRKLSPGIDGIYRNLQLRDLLRQVTSGEVHTCPYEPEQYVITNLTQAGDTHGWHWDDYSYALVWVVNAPGPEEGGLVQFISSGSNSDTKEVNTQLLNGIINTRHMPSGSVYLLNARKCLHRVTEMQKGASRAMINMAFATEAELKEVTDHTTVEKLWA